MQNSAQLQKQLKHQENNKSANAAAAPPKILNHTNSSPHATTVASSQLNSTENETDNPESRYECPICLHWLNVPVLTSCGHRFCKSCLNSWLRQNKQCCPIDNKILSTEFDIFPDNYTRREIDQIKFKCPNSRHGCDVIATPIEMDRHLPTCPCRETTEEKCPFASIKCDFVGRAETNAMEEHIKDDMPHHMLLILQAFQQTAIANWHPQKNGKQANGALPPPPPQYANEADEQLVQALYQRIVLLEQRTREQDVKVENLSKQLNMMRQQVDPRYSNGTIVWEVRDFRALMERLRANANNQVYSDECYTSPYGYKFCARLNIQPRWDHLLSLHVHLMQSENDHHLEWPFKGRIKLCMIHPRETQLSQHDTIMTKPQTLAFHKPRERISTRGFGFVEYANIPDIVQKGFCENDRLVIKIQINIV